MPSWQTIGLTVDLDQLDGLTDPLGSALDGVSSVLQVVSAAINLVTFTLSELPSATSAVVDEAVSLVEQAVLDITENNAGLAVHLNTKWDPDWKYERGPEDDSNRIRDFVNDREIPWRGTGIRGWLLDLAYSAQDPTDPFRPVSDEDTAVSGVLFLKGVSSGGELARLIPASDVFLDFREIREKLNIKEKLEEAPETWRDLLRLGPAATDAAWERLPKPRDVLQGTLIVNGDEGLNAPDSTFFYDDTWTSTDDFSDIRVGDALKLNNSPVFYEVVDIVGGVRLGLEVSPAIARDNSLAGQIWEVRRGGMAGLLAALPAELADYRPVPGSYPKWVSVPMSAAIPGLAELFEGLQGLARSIKGSASHADSVTRLAALLREKARLLRLIIEEIEALLDQVDDLVSFFTEAHILVASVDSGGMGAFINQAISADNLPDFGSNGVVVGAALVTTSADPSNHLENFFSMIGLPLSTFAAETTARREALARTWDDEF
jgi:hypothetical protein